ncbi:MAG: hypothetical protein K2X81_21750 [Candidatus Obscuribacterales bacterium]|nr:hypothetical protein [Candidatus Obscuribacterales bacterium]
MAKVLRQSMSPQHSLVTNLMIKDLDCFLVSERLNLGLGESLGRAEPLVVVLAGAFAEVPAGVPTEVLEELTVGALVFPVEVLALPLGGVNVVLMALSSSA